MAKAEPTDQRGMRLRTRHSALIEAARTLFIERGYRGTTLAQIIAVAGGSKETIYKRFGGKIGVFAAIIAQNGERLASSIVSPAALNTPPREELTRLGLDLAAILQSAESRAAHEVILSEGMKSPELVHAWYQGGSALVIEALESYFMAQIRAGNLLSLDAPLVARQFITLLMAELAFPFIGGMQHAVSREKHVERCVDIIIRAYGSTRLQTLSSLPSSPELLPMEVSGPTVILPDVCLPGGVEVIAPSGHRVRLAPPIDACVLKAVLAALR